MNMGKFIVILTYVNPLWTDKFISIKEAEQSDLRISWDILCVYVHILYLNASRLRLSNIHTICTGLLSEDGYYNVAHYVAQLGKKGNLFLNKNDQNKAYIPIMRTRWNSI